MHKYTRTHMCRWRMRAREVIGRRDCVLCCVCAGLLPAVQEAALESDHTQGESESEY